ncbi:hypothetical protein F4703DRAFT_1791254 [Phycomyces blakesleeanus]
MDVITITETLLNSIILFETQCKTETVDIRNKVPKTCYLFTGLKQKGVRVRDRDNVWPNITHVFSVAVNRKIDICLFKPTSNSVIYDNYLYEKVYKKTTRLTGKKFKPYAHLSFSLTLNEDTPFQVLAVKAKRQATGWSPELFKPLKDLVTKVYTISIPTYALSKYIFLADLARDPSFDING